MIQQIIKGLQIEDLCKCGVYCIFHEAKPDRLYIGSTATIGAIKVSHRGFYRRFYIHLRDLKLNKHHSNYLQNTVNKYGAEGIVFKILEICDDVRMREQYYIDLLKPVYNTFDTIHPQGRKWSYEERQRQSLKMKGIALPATVYVKRMQSVYQYDDTGALVNKYGSIKEAAENTGIDRASISKSAYGKRKTAGGYVWSLTAK